MNVRLIQGAFALAAVISLIVVSLMSRPVSNPGILIMYDSRVRACTQDICQSIADFRRFGCELAFCDDGTGNMLSGLPVPLKVFGPNGMLIADSTMDLVNGTMQHTLMESGVTNVSFTAFPSILMNQCRDDTVLSFYGVRALCLGTETVLCFCFKS